jgi:hypothetical protein
VYPELEAGLEMTRQVLLALHVPVTEIQRQTEALRQEYFTSRVSQRNGIGPCPSSVRPNSSSIWNG